MVRNNSRLFFVLVVVVTFMITSGISFAQASPEYIANAVTGSDGLTDEYTYSFSSGAITLLPNRNQTLLMVGGEFLPYLVEIREDRSLVPLRFVTQAFGATVDWNGDTNTVTMVLGDTTATVVIGEKYAKVVKDDRESEHDLYTTAVIINERAYIPIRAMSEIFNKETGYEAGNIITYNPFVWIDEKTPAWRPDTYAIKADCSKSLAMLQENIDTIENGAFKDWGDTNEKAFAEIQNRIDGIRLMRFIGRYALLEGPYLMLAEQDGAVYFHTAGHTEREISARSFDEPGLFLPGYFLGGFPGQPVQPLETPSVEGEQATDYIYGTSWDYSYTTISDESGAEKPYNIPELKIAPPYIEIDKEGRVICIFYESRREGTLVVSAPNAYTITNIKAQSEGSLYSADDDYLLYDPQSGLLRYTFSDTNARHYFKKR